MTDHTGTVIFNAHYISRPSAGDFLRGARATFNLSGVTEYEYYFGPSAADADRNAARNDWDAVADDFEQALRGAIE